VELVLGPKLSIKTLNEEINKLKKDIEVLKTEADKEKDTQIEFKEIINRLSKTFWSILLFNYILIIMGIVAFILATVNAFGGKIELTILFGALGFADIGAIFRFSMDRVQRSLGDQVQLFHVNKGHNIQMAAVKKFAPKDIAEVGKYNGEVRKATINSMKLIQDFTKIAEPLSNKPWIRSFPGRFSQMKLNGNLIKGEFEVKEDEEIELSGSIFNSSYQRLKISAVAIAVRPPGGTPDGGPFRFDFYIDTTEHTLQARQTLEIVSKPKKILINSKTGKKELLRNDWYGKDWYAFMTCQTEDGCWQDDHNKYWFELKKKTP
jgi:hypothetical protein